MDIVTHAIVGAATGLPFGRPVLGAVVAIVPDLVLGYKRKLEPSGWYDVTHSLSFLLFVYTAVWLLIGPATALVVALALASHLVLDMPTHGAAWAPPLLYPFHTHRVSLGLEWEFFNESWMHGLLVSLIWILTCVWIKVLVP